MLPYDIAENKCLSAVFPVSLFKHVGIKLSYNLKDSLHNVDVLHCITLKMFAARELFSGMHT